MTDPKRIEEIAKKFHTEYFTRLFSGPDVHRIDSERRGYDEEKDGWDSDFFVEHRAATIHAFEVMLQSGEIEIH